MPGTPEFTIETPTTVTGEQLRAEENRLAEFLADPFKYSEFGYFTLDFRDTGGVTLDGLVQIAAMAHQIEQTQGHLQLVNVRESAYYPLMNTNIGNKRLISLAEIYTKRSEPDIFDFTNAIEERADELGVDASQIFHIVNTSHDVHKKLHGSYRHRPPNYHELMRRREEFKLISCQRYIEDNKKDPTITNHLSYRFGEGGRIATLDTIPDMLGDIQKTAVSTTTQPFPEKGKTYYGECVKWFSDKGYGFLQPDGREDNVFVHITDTRGYQGCERWHRYSFQVIEVPKGLEAKDVVPLDVTHL